LIKGIIKGEQQEASAAYHTVLWQNELVSLLEQHMGDLFSTNLGNVLAGGRVRRLGMLWLRHDAEVGGLQFIVLGSPGFQLLP